MTMTIRKTFVILLLSLLRLSHGDDDSPVTCGSAIKLTHVESGGNYYLNSANMNLGSGSGQQLVTVIPDNSKTSSMWLLLEADGENKCNPGTPIKCGQKIRLMHLDTGKNLHSHLVQSVLSKQQEVSCFGDGGQGDTGDDFQVVCSGSVWIRGENMRLLHVDTQKYLGASSRVKYNEQNCGGQCPIKGQLEAFGRKGKDDYSNWKVELGVHLSK